MLPPFTKIIPPKLLLLYRSNKFWRFSVISGSFSPFLHLLWSSVVSPADSFFYVDQRKLRRNMKVDYKQATFISVFIYLLFLCYIRFSIYELNAFISRNHLYFPWFLISGDGNQIHTLVLWFLLWIIGAIGFCVLSMRVCT